MKINQHLIGIKKALKISKTTKTPLNIKTSFNSKCKILIHLKYNSSYKITSYNQIITLRKG